MVHLAFVTLSCLAVSPLQMSSAPSAALPPQQPTLRSLASTLEEQRWGGQDIFQRTADMKQRTDDLAPLTASELDDVIYSIQNLQATSSSATSLVDGAPLRALLAQVAHLSHTNWSVTQANGQRLQQVLLPEGIPAADTNSAPPPPLLLQRVLTEGQWEQAVAHGSRRPTNAKPWAVLVTGVNGIRKTTSLYQDWFPQLLTEALVAPPAPEATARTAAPWDTTLLPTGQNSFFRQLDHMIASLCNEDFGILYQLTSNELEKGGESAQSSSLQAYADLKAAIFGRYRTLSELLGAALLDQAKQRGANCLMETSGRDVAMFHYVNHFFPDDSHYHKLALHFEINDLTQAQASVDRRMQGELETGLQALQAKSAQAVAYANAGGPYGAAALPGVQAASDDVWNTHIQPADSVVAADWYKATIQIQAYADKPWTARAVTPDGSQGTLFTFAPLS
jgi:hypothetical protein